MRKKIIVLLLLLITSISIGFSVYKQKTLLFKDPFQKEEYFSDPSSATMDKEHNIYVIDSLMKRVIKLDKDNKIDYRIAGGKKGEKNFCYANEIAVDDQGCLYILNHVLDEQGLYMEKEEIIKYDSKGHFEKVVYTKEYSPTQHHWTLMKRGQILGLSVEEKYVYWYEVNKENVVYYKLDAVTNHIEIQKTTSFEQADVIVVDIARINDQQFVYSTKKGEIYKTEPNNDQNRVYFAEAETDKDGGMGKSIPWEIGLDKDQNIYLTDLGKREITLIDEKGNTKTIVSQETLEQAGYDSKASIFFKMHVTQDGTMVFLDNENIVVANAKGHILTYISYGLNNTSLKFKIIWVWLKFILAFLLLIKVLNIIYVDVMKREISPVLTKSIGIILVLIISTIIVSSMMLDNFMGRYIEAAENQLAHVVQQMPTAIDGDKFEDIERLSQFMNEDYQVIREQLHQALNYNRDDWNKDYYAALYKAEDNQVNAFMYFNDSIGTNHPLNVALDEPGYLFYDAYVRGQILTATEHDAEGSWLYGLGPIYNSKGEIVGMIEVGRDLNEFLKGNKKIIKDLVMEMATVLIILLFTIIEITIFGDIINKRKGLARAEKDGSIYETDIIRPLSFILSTGIFMSLTFIPIVMKDLYDPSYGISESIMIAIPISAEMLFAGVSKVGTGYMVDRKGWKANLLVGLSILFTGTVLSGLTSNPIVFIIARSIVGIGVGTVMISLRSFVNTAQTEEGKSEGFVALNSGAVAGINVGVAIGSMLATKQGFSQVFYVASIILIIGVLFVIFLTKDTPLIIKGIHLKEESGSVLEFFTDKKVIAFFILILIPGYLCGMFLNYFFPLFAESNGISPADVGRAFILNGLCVIYLGPPLSKFFEKRFGNKKSLVGGVLLGAMALFIFATTANIKGAFITVILLGVMDSFGVAAQNNYFLSFDAVQKIGELKSIAFFELVGNLGEMIGPIVFGVALILGPALGTMVVGIISIVTMLLYLVITKKPTHNLSQCVNRED